MAEQPTIDLKAGSGLRIVGPGEGGAEPYDDQGNFVATEQRKSPRTPYDFDGTPIEETVMKVTSATNLEIDDRIMRIDDYVEMRVIGRVMSVDHKLDDKTGKTKRIHLVKVIEVDFTRAWSPAGGVEYK